MKYYKTFTEEEIIEADNCINHIFRTTNRIVDPFARSILDAQSLDELHQVYLETPEIREELIYLRLCTRKKIELMGGPRVAN